MSAKCEQTCIYYKVQANKIVRICPEPIVIDKKVCAKQAQSNINHYCFNCICCFIYPDYLWGAEAAFKLIEISFCCLAVSLGIWVNGVGGEKGFAVFVAVFSLLCTIVILITKLATLHRYLTPKHWFAMESAIYVALSCGFFTAAALLILIGVNYWTANDPTHQLLPLILSIVTIFSGFLYIADAILVYRHRRIRTWIPFVSEYKI